MRSLGQRVCICAKPKDFLAREADNYYSDAKFSDKAHLCWLATRKVRKSVRAFGITILGFVLKFIYAPFPPQSGNLVRPEMLSEHGIGVEDGCS